MSLLAALAAAAAAALVLPAMPGPASGHPGRRPRATLPAGVAVAVVAGAAVSHVEGATLALTLIVVGAALAAARLTRLVRRRHAAAAIADVVLELCEALAGELRAGQPAEAALQRGVGLWPDFAPVATAARLGSDVPTALRRLGRRPGAGALRDLASAWQVSGDTGAGLAVALTQVTGSVRAAAATRRVVAAELASAQATARLVAALPLFSLAMGSGVGGEPMTFLLRSPLGLWCLAAGLALGFAGLLWIERISSRVAER